MEPFDQKCFSKHAEAFCLSNQAADKCMRSKNLRGKNLLDHDEDCPAPALLVAVESHSKGRRGFRNQIGAVSAHATMLGSAEVEKLAS